jgi:aspartoacylase
VPVPAQGYAGLPSICSLGGTIEVGPVAPGVLQATAFQKTEFLVHHALDYVECHNQGQLPALAPAITTYQQVGVMDYPRDDQGVIQAMIHPSIQSQDYSAPPSRFVPLFILDGRDSPLRREQRGLPDLH